MKPFRCSSSEQDRISHAAAEWVLRLDRGLSPSEQDAYSQWLAADSRHRDMLAAHRWGWDELDRLAGIQDTVHALPDPDLLQPHRRAPRVFRYWRKFAGGLAAVLAMTAALLWWRGAESNDTQPVARVEPSYALAAPIQERTLEDGSIVALNRGALIETRFSSEQRLVLLRRGEANFVVATDAERPFVVRAGNVEVRAVGTEFNVRLGDDDVEVLVSHGQVGVSSRGAAAIPALVERESTAREPAADTEVATAAVRPGEVLLVANQKVVLPLAEAPAAAPVAIATLDEQERERRLAWQPRLLDFTDAPMSAIVAEFNRRNTVRLVLAEPSLDRIRLSATFRSDNVEGFLRLLQSDFGLRVEWRGEVEVVLSRK